MIKQHARTSILAPRVLAPALIVLLAAAAHAQNTAPRDLPPYLPPEAGGAAATNSDNASGDNASSDGSASPANADAAASDGATNAPAESAAGRAPAPRSLPPRPLAPRDNNTDATPAAKPDGATTSGAKSGGTSRNSSANRAASTRARAAAPARATLPRSVAPAQIGAKAGAVSAPSTTRATAASTRATTPTGVVRNQNATSPATRDVAPNARSAASLPSRAANAPISAMRGASASLLSGAMPPLEVRFRQLGEGWQRVTVVAPTVSAAQSAASTRSATSETTMRITQLYGGGSGVFFTRGETLKTGSETFLALYKMRIEAREIAALFPKGAGTPEVSTRAVTAFFSERPLELSLVNVRTIGALRDIRPFSQTMQAAQVRALFSASPQSGASTRNATYSAMARANLLRLGGAIDLYAKAHGGTLPPLQTFAVARAALLPYAGRLVFSHPASNANFRFNPVLSGRKIAHIAQPRDMVSAYETPSSGARRAVLFLDGTVRFLSEAQWLKYSRGSKIK